MKPTQITELFATIKKTFVSFFSILMFVALGVGVFLGISWSGPALQNAADRMFDEGRLHNFQIQYMYGLTDADIAQLSEIEGVTHVEAGHQSLQVMRQGASKRTIKVVSIGKDINVPIVREGTMPSKPGEIALSTASARELNLSVGETIWFEHDASADDPANLLTSAVDAASSGQAGSTDSADAASQGQASNTSGMKYLTTDKFTVTAIIDSAEYAAKSPETFGYSNFPSGAVNAIVWVPDETFVHSAFQNGYPVVNVACESLAGRPTLSDDYAKASKDIEKRIVELGNELHVARFADLHGQAEAKVLEAEKKLAEGKQKITDGEKQLEAGKAELETKKAEGERKLTDGLRQLEDFEVLRAQGEAALAQARTEVEAGEAALAVVDAAKAEAASAVNDADAYLKDQNAKLKRGEITPEQYAANLDAYAANVNAKLKELGNLVGKNPPVIDHTNFAEIVSQGNAFINDFESMKVTYNGQTMTVSEARVKLADGRKQLNAAEAEYNQRVAQLNEGWAAYYAGQDELNRLVAEGEKKIADGEKELADAKAQVAENEPKVIAARAQLDDMKDNKWAVMPRAFNAGVVEVTTFSTVTNSLSISMAALFIIVGLLVSYFAVSRLVHEQVTQIGTKKALGFRQGEITMSFLLYSGIAVLAGAIIGTIVGVTVVEGIIDGVLAGMFAFGAYPPYFGWGLFLGMTLLELGLILGATYLACRSILKQHAVELLRGEKPPSGKTRFYEKWGIWDRLPLFIQTIVNNCVNDKRRMLSTIVGVAGATALIVTAITLNNDVMKSYDFHYSNVYGFNAITYVESEPDNAAENVEADLQGQGASTARTLMKRYIMEMPDGSSAAMRIVVPLDEDAFGKMYHVNVMDGEPLDLSREGAWVSQAYAKHAGAKVGDNIVLDGGDGTTHEVPILGIYEFWLTYHEMVVGADYYQKEFGNAYANAVLTQTNGTNVRDVRLQMAATEGFDSIVDDATYQYGNFETFSSVSGAVVAIYLALAALMAVVVLLNLNVMFIEEKKRELIVLMINGFSVKDAKHYIAYDSIVLTALGIIVGLVLGCIMGSVTVAAIEPSTGVFVKSADMWAIIIGIVGSAVLAIIMGAIAQRRIPKFNLTDINKQ